MSNYGLKWTDGVDVSTAKLENLIISSSHPCLKFAFSGTGSITYNHDSSSNDIWIVKHNLGYKPLFIVLTQWFNIDTDSKETSYRKAPLFDNLLSGAIYFNAKPYVTTTELRYYVYSFTGSGSESITLKYIYFVYYDPDQDI